MHQTLWVISTAAAAVDVEVLPQLQHHLAPQQHLLHIEAQDSPGHHLPHAVEETDLQLQIWKVAQTCHAGPAWLALAAASQKPSRHVASGAAAYSLARKVLASCLGLNLGAASCPPSPIAASAELCWAFAMVDFVSAMLKLASAIPDLASAVPSLFVSWISAQVSAVLSWACAGLFAASARLFGACAGLFGVSAGLFAASAGLFGVSAGLFEASVAVIEASAGLLQMSACLAARQAAFYFHLNHAAAQLRQAPVLLTEACAVQAAGLMLLGPVEDWLDQATAEEQLQSGAASAGPCLAEHADALHMVLQFVGATFCNVMSLYWAAGWQEASVSQGVAPLPDWQTVLCLCCVDASAAQDCCFGTQQLTETAVKPAS